MSFYDIPFLGGIFRGIAGATDPNGIVGNQSAAQQAGAKTTVGATSQLMPAVNQYRPGMDPGVNAMLGQAGLAANGVGTAANAQNRVANPGFNGEAVNMGLFRGLAQNGSAAAQDQLRLGQQQQQAIQNSQAMSANSGMSPAQLQAAMAQGNAVQGQNNALAQQMLRAQGQLAGQQLYGQAAGQYGQGSNSALGTAQQGQVAAADARNQALGTRGQYALGQQGLNQDYLNTLGGIANQGYAGANNYQGQQRQAVGNVASGVGSFLSALV